MTKIANNLKVIGTGSSSQALGVTAGNLNVSNGMSIGTWTLPSDSQVYILSASTSTIPLRVRDYSNGYDSFKVNNDGTVEIKNGQTSTSSITLTIGSTSSLNGKGVIQLGSTSSGTKFVGDAINTSFISGNGKWGFNTNLASVFYYNSIYMDISGSIPVIGSNTNESRAIRLASGGGKIYFSIGPSSSTGDVMNISASGNVAIGTFSNATGRLHVYTTGTGSSTIAFRAQNLNNDGYFQITDDGSAILNGTTYSNRTSLSIQGQGNGGQLVISVNDGTSTGLSSSLNYIEGYSNGIKISPINGKNIYLSTTASVYIGVTNSRVGLFGATSISRPTTAYSSSTIAYGVGNVLKDDDTFDGYTLSQIVKVLRDIGILT